MDDEIGTIRFDVTKSLWLWGMLIGAAFAHWTLPRFAVTTALTFVTVCLGHSVGLHRGTIHRGYETSPFVQRLLLWLGVMSGLGGPLSWARYHAIRDHWQNQADCPPYFAYDHSLGKDFAWNLHTRFHPADDRALSRLPSDLLTDRWLMFLEATWPLHTLVFAAIVYVTLGPDWVATLVCARIAAALVGHWFVGYAAHVWGDQPYVIDGAKESGTNVWLLGVLSFGEGFHNNHHRYPRSCRYGRRTIEVDLGWISLLALQRLHVVRALRTE